MSAEIEELSARQRRATASHWLRSIVILLIAFLTLVDLFATQAILPTLAAAYRVSPAAMGLAVNASTLGMAVAGLAVAFFGGRIERRRGIVASLVLLAVPTTLLAVAPDLATFALLRVAQGLCMASAFALTLAYLGEVLCAKESPAAFAAYITGNVASNLFGRMMAAALAEHLGLAANFLVFALMNLAGAALVYFTLRRTRAASMPATRASPWHSWAGHLRNPALRASFAIGFLILFAFIGTFTYVNFVLVRAPLGLGPMMLGFVYLVFLPSMATTPIAGRIVSRFGSRAALIASLALAAAALPLLLATRLDAVLLGLALVAIGTFFAQATATGFVARAATSERGAASGLYLASYFAGGLAGSALLGQLFDRLGWTACTIGIGAALLVAALLARGLSLPEAEAAQ